MDRLFTLRVPGKNKSDKMIVIDAYEAGSFYPSHHTRLDVSVKQGGKVIFPRGSLYCGIPGHSSIDSNFAKEVVLSLVAMKPGDTDEEYFNDYTPEQLAWAEDNGEYLDIVKYDRYGNVK